jgi:hypothetical protein
VRVGHQEVPGAEVQVAEGPAVEVQVVDQGQWASVAGIDRAQEGIHGLVGGTIRAGHHTAGNQDRDGMEEVVQIAVRREGRNLAGIGAAGGNREE